MYQIVQPFVFLNLYCVQVETSSSPALIMYVQVLEIMVDTSLTNIMTNEIRLRKCRQMEVHFHYLKDLGFTGHLPDTSW